MKCYNCDKGVSYGHNVSHAKNRTRKIFKPNLHETRIMMGNNRKKVRLCTKCLRLYKKMENMSKESVGEAAPQNTSVSAL